MARFYSDVSRESEKYSLPDAEVFYIDGKGDWTDSDGNLLEKGWYFQFCFPGCLPESDPFGPYESEAEAVKTCREDYANG